MTDNSNTTDSNNKSLTAADTCRRVAAIRAVASEASNNVYQEPLARVLAGEQEYAFIRNMEKDIPKNQVNTVVCRSMIIDKLLLSYCNQNTTSNGSQQIVILGCGMDTRCYRLKMPTNSKIHWFEVDQPDVIELKEEILAKQPGISLTKSTTNDETSSSPDNITRTKIDLATHLDDLIPALKSKGFKTDIPTIFILEGLVYYIPKEGVTKIFQTLASSSTTKDDKIICTCIDSELKQVILKDEHQNSGLIPKSFVDNHRQLWKTDLTQLQQECLVGSGWVVGSNNPIIEVSSAGAAQMELGVTTNMNIFRGYEYVFELQKEHHP